MDREQEGNVYGIERSHPEAAVQKDLKLEIASLAESWLTFVPLTVRDESPVVQKSHLY